MPSMDANGINISYDSVGKGPSVVFVHGGYGGASSTVVPRDEGWVEGLADSYNVITYDRRSSGQTSYPASEHTLDMFVDDLAGLLDGLGISKMFLIGSSAGGPIALKYSFKYPESIIGLILANTSSRIWAHEGRLAASKELEKRIALLREKGSEEAFNILRGDDLDAKPFHLVNQKPNPMPVGFDTTRNQKIKRLQHALNRDSKIKYFAGELRNQAAYLDSDVTANLGSIGVPTLVVHGNLDTQVPYDLGKELSVHIKNARFVTIPKAGHGVMQWPKSVSAIQEFCDEIMSLKKG